MIEPLPPDIAALYELTIQGVVKPFEGQVITPMTRSMLTASILLAQSGFLHHRPEYTALWPVRLIDLGNNRFEVDAPICTVAKKMEFDRDTRERERIVAELDARIRKDAERRRRSWVNMLRQHGRLLARHGDRIPPSTARIWDSLDTGQQYAILKDIDYDVRHGRVK